MLIYLLMQCIKLFLPARAFNWDPRSLMNNYVEGYKETTDGISDENAGNVRARKKMSKSKV